MLVALSSLIPLFTGEDDSPPVYSPALAALICDGLSDVPSNLFAVAERIFPELDEVGPRTFDKYVEVVGREAMDAVRDGFELWKLSRAA